MISRKKKSFFCSSLCTFAFISNQICVNFFWHFFYAQLTYILTEINDMIKRIMCNFFYFSSLNCDFKKYILYFMKTSILNMFLMHMILTVNCILCRKSPNLIQNAKIQSQMYSSSTSNFKHYVSRKNKIGKIKLSLSKYNPILIQIAHCN